MQKNCFNTIKFIAAILVMSKHAFPISLGEGSRDFLSVFTNNQVDLGNLGVCLFFIIGGYFITKSFTTSKNTKEYLTKRIKKIFPSLILALFIMVFIIAPFFYEGNFFSYYLNVDNYIYFLKNSLLITTHYLPGIFSNNIYNLSVNGSLWTLPVEFLCYIAIIFAFMFKLLEKKNIKFTYILIVLLTLCQLFIYNYIPIMETILPLGLLFLSGAVYYIKKDNIKFKGSIALLFIILIILSFFFNMYIYTKILLLPYVIYYIGFNLGKDIRIPSVLEHISYEIYLFGFFIQQAVCHIFGGNMNPYINIAIALPITIFIAYITDYLLNNIIISKINKRTRI